MSLVMVRQKVKPDSVEQAEKAVHEMFAALDRLGPDSVRYASTRIVDSTTFVALFELAEGAEDPRPAIPEFQRFMEGLRDWVDGPPSIEHLDVVDSYRLFGDSRD